MAQFLEMVEDLVAGDAARAGDPQGLLQVGNIEIAHAPGQDLPFAPKLLEGRECLLQRVVTPPVQEVAVQPVGLEARERPLAGRDRPAPRGILRKDLGDQEDLVASPGDRLGDKILGGARQVHLRGVDVGHAEIEAPPQRIDRRAGVFVVVVPGPLADHRDLALGGSEWPSLHVRTPGRTG